MVSTGERGVSFVVKPDWGKFFSPQTGCVWLYSGMANPQKLSRADVFRHIDAFRGIVNRRPGARLSAEQWAEFKRAERELAQKKAQRN